MQWVTVMLAVPLLLVWWCLSLGLSGYYQSRDSCITVYQSRLLNEHVVDGIRSTGDSDIV